VTALLILRVTLLVALFVYVAAVAAGAMGLVSAAFAWPVSIVSAITLAISALGCVALQIFQMISDKRRRTHG
jgi:hypothetical protein